MLYFSSIRAKDSLILTILLYLLYKMEYSAYSKVLYT